MTSEIKPSQTIGSADLVVNVSDTPGLISGSVDIDNAGNRFTGAIRTGVSANVSNPLQLGDQFSLRYFTSGGPFSSREFMDFTRIAYVVPVGYWGTRVGVSYATFNYRLGKDFFSSETHGAGAVETLYAFHPFIRTRGANLIGQFAYEVKNLNDRVDTTADRTRTGSSNRPRSASSATSATRCWAAA